MIRTELLNHLVSALGYNRYLEIGVFNGDNFRAVNCTDKVSVDPSAEVEVTFKGTSDEYFSSLPSDYLKFDLVFVDGLHHSEQVYRDIVNSIKYTREGGTIVVHDCNPYSYESQLVPRQQDIWNGDVWLAWYKFRLGLLQLGCHKTYTVNTDEGCGVLEVVDLPQNVPHVKAITYDEFVKDKKNILNLVSVEEFKRLTQKRKKV